MPTRIMCGMTDSDEIDCQAGYETEQNLMTGMLTGANILVNCLGTLDSLMCTSYEKFIIDEELLKRFYRITDGLDASEESLSLDIIQEVTQSGGNYLTHESTLKYCRYHWRPTVSCRGRHRRIMQGGGSEDLVAAANKRFKEILANQPESIIDSSLERELHEFLTKTG